MTFPVAVDRDLAVFNLYRVGVLQHGRRRPRRGRCGSSARTSRSRRRSWRRCCRDDRDRAGSSEDLEGEFPALRLRWIEHEGGSGRTPPEIKERLRGLSNRYTGGKAVHLRQEPIPWAYRVFFRQVGIDPDDHRTPAEQAALDRMKHGAFRSRNLLDDALVIATVETGVPLIALDADRVGTPLGLRLSHAGERLGGEDGRAAVRPPDRHRRPRPLGGRPVRRHRRGARGGPADDADAALQRPGQGRARDQRRGGPVDRHGGTADRGVTVYHRRVASVLKPPPPSLPLVTTGPDERAARRDLLEQIARLESDLSALFCSAYPRGGFDWARSVPRRAARAVALRAGAAARRPCRAPPRRPPHARRPHLGRGAEPAADRGDDARRPRSTSGCASAPRTSASAAASTGTCARASESSA